MKKIEFIVRLISIVIATFTLFIIPAQNIGINAAGALPDPSAALDISANDKGVLFPRIALTGTNDLVTIASPATSLLIYNTATVSDVTPGFYYFDGSIWVPMGGSTAGNDWYEVGGTTPADQITDTIYTKGMVGIGTASPTETLEVNGYLKIINGTEGENKVLVSDALGRSTWKALPGTWMAYLSEGESFPGLGGQVTINFSNASVVGQGGGANVTNDNITVPNSGTYKVSISAWASGFTSPYLVQWELKVNGVNTWEPHYSGASSSWGTSASTSTLLFLNAGDILSLDRLLSTPGGSNDGATNEVILSVEFIE
ncbi:MAG: hypothetical protein N4A35_01115 [Flavobacteriales bacterium]|jgi:hypothetical protein|nr:hypothetical protein [Flavobacteriales bacterium]